LIFIPFYTGKFLHESPENKYTEADYTQKEKDKIKEHAKWRKARHFGDPAGKQHTITDTSVIRKLSKAGIHVFTNEKSKRFAPRREATKMLLRILYVNKGNEHFLECIKQARYPERKQESQSTAPVVKPVHDYTADFRSALEYLAINLGIRKAKSRRVDYLKKNTTDSEGNLKESIRIKEKKKKILRWSFRSY